MVLDQLYIQVTCTLSFTVYVRCRLCSSCSLATVVSKVMGMTFRDCDSYKKIISKRVPYYAESDKFRNHGNFLFFHSISWYQCSEEKHMWGNTALVKLY